MRSFNIGSTGQGHVLCLAAGGFVTHFHIGGILGVVVEPGPLGSVRVGSSSYLGLVYSSMWYSPWAPGIVGV